MLSVIMIKFHYAECHYAECHYTECHYAECHYAGSHYADCHGNFLNYYIMQVSGQNNLVYYGRKIVYGIEPCHSYFLIKVWKIKIIQHQSKISNGARLYRPILQNLFQFFYIMAR